MGPFRILLAGILLASAAQADWLLSAYSAPAADSAAVNRLYGIKSFQNPSSRVTTKVEGGAVSLVASVIASDSTEGFTANIGLLHPLTPGWKAFDLTGLTAIEFEFRNSETITDYLSVSFGSNAYPDSLAKAGIVYDSPISGSVNLDARTDWKKARIDIADFSTPSWWTDIPMDYPPFEDVLKGVTNLQFAPKTRYSGSGSVNGKACTKCVTPTMASQVLEIRNIVLVGPQKVPMPNPGRIGCSGTPEVLDALYDDDMNDFGGYWFSYSDSNSVRADSRGSSSSAFSLLLGDEFVVGNISLKADLDKRVGSIWHKNAGWAALGTNFEGAGYRKAPLLTGIAFRVDSDSLPSEIEGVRFLVQLLGVSDTATHSVMIPAWAVKQPGGTEACIRPEDLVMPEHVVDAERSDFDPGFGIKQLAWEVRIADRRDTTLSTAHARFSVSNVRLYGTVDKWLFPAVQPRSPSHPFSITYAHGSLNLRGLVGIATVDILGLDGRRVATFASASSIPLQLSRGTWILAAHRRDGSVSTQPFAVLDR